MLDRLSEPLGHLLLVGRGGGGRRGGLGHRIGDLRGRPDPLGLLGIQSDAEQVLARHGAHFLDAAVAGLRELSGRSGGDPEPSREGFHDLFFRIRGAGRDRFGGGTHGRTVGLS